MTLPVVIEDGYTRKSYIDELPGVHGKLYFHWRGTTDDERAAYMDALRSCNDRAQQEHKLAGEALNRHILSWSAGDKNPDRIRKLQPTLWKRLVGIVLWGDQAPDGDDPSWDASLRGLPLGENASLEEVLAKNSETGSTS